MAGRRIAYGTVLVCCFVFYCFFEEWFSWLLLMAVVFLPVFSLLVSLPAMLTVRWQLFCPTEVQLGIPARITAELACPLPPPPVRCKVKLQNSLTGHRFVGEPGEHIPTEHCGKVTVTCHKPYIYDYLGLFRIKAKPQQAKTLYVLPRPVAAQLPGRLLRQTVTLWRPKPGGGFSENHDLRLYRPGDDLRNIHWKMAAKTGKLIYREAMEPVEQQLQLTLTLSGYGEQLNRKLGALSYISARLLEKELAHQVVCYTGSGILSLEVTDRATREQMLRALLSAPAMQGEALSDEEQRRQVCYIGGGSL